MNLSELHIPSELLLALTAVLCFVLGICIERLRSRSLRAQAEAAGSAELAVLRDKASRVPALESEVGTLREERAMLTTRIEGERKGLEEKIALLEKAKEELSHAFHSLSAEALRNNNNSFLELARTALDKHHEQAKGDLEKRQQAIGELVSPVKESLHRFQAQIEQLELTRRGAYEGLTEQVKTLTTIHGALKDETTNLVRALGTPRVRGRWGEIQLKRVVELAGMLDHCDFHEQVSFTNEEKDIFRPDLIVNLPAGRTIVVDAKAPLSAYLEAMEQVDEAQRAAKLKQHARQIRDHMTALSRKSYWDKLEKSPEFVVLFLPGDTFYSVALEHDPELLEFGAQERVILATPITLIALLKAVAYGWRQEAVVKNAEQIGALGKEIYKRIAKLGEHFGDIGDKLSRAVESYNKAVGTLESKVLVSARRFRDLESTGLEEQIELLPTVEKNPRALAAAELCIATEELPTPATAATEQQKDIL